MFFQKTKLNISFFEFFFKKYSKLLNELSIFKTNILCSFWLNLKFWNSGEKFQVSNQGYKVIYQSPSITLPPTAFQVLLFPQVLFGKEEGYYGNQDSNAERNGGAVDPDVSQHAAVLPD